MKSKKQANKIKVLIGSLILVLIGFLVQALAIILVLDSAGKTCLDGEDSCYNSGRYLSTENLNDRVESIRRLVPVGYVVMGVGAVGFLVSSTQLILGNDKLTLMKTRTVKHKK